MEPPNSGTHPFVLCKEVVVVFPEVILYRVCILEYIWYVLCWEVCSLSQCPFIGGFTVAASYQLFHALKGGARGQTAANLAGHAMAS